MNNDQPTNVPAPALDPVATQNRLNTLQRGQRDLAERIKLLQRRLDANRSEGRRMDAELHRLRLDASGMAAEARRLIARANGHRAFKPSNDAMGINRRQPDEPGLSRAPSAPVR